MIISNGLWGRPGTDVYHEVKAVFVARTEDARIGNVHGNVFCRWIWGAGFICTSFRLVPADLYIYRRTWYSTECEILMKQAYGNEKEWERHSVFGEEEQPAGTWGQRHLHYLKQYRRVTYTNLLTCGKLNTYLAPTLISRRGNALKGLLRT